MRQVQERDHWLNDVEGLCDYDVHGPSTSWWKQPQTISKPRWVFGLLVYGMAAVLAVTAAMCFVLDYIIFIDGE